MELSDEKKRLVDLVEPIVVSYFGLECQFDIYCRKRHQKLANARFCLWYFLHYGKGFTLGELSAQYDRTIQNICSGLSKIEYRKNKAPFYKDMYNGFISCLEKEGIAI